MPRTLKNDQLCSCIVCCFPKERIKSLNTRGGKWSVKKIKGHLKFLLNFSGLADLFLSGSPCLRVSIFS